MYLRNDGYHISIVIIIIIIIYYKIVHEVHDRLTYSENNESSKSSNKHKH